MTGDHPVYAFDAAIVREPAQSVTKGLRAGDHADPAYDGIKAEHDAYIAALTAAGVDVIVLSRLDAFPDSIFVEDPALVFSEGAILLRSNAPSRAGEAGKIAPALREHFDTVLALPETGFADGGDILATPKGVMIGLSGRTTPDGAEALKECLSKLGRWSEIVRTPQGVLHFKSDCALLDQETILTTARLARSGVFEGFDQVIVPEGEAAAANALRVNDVVMVGAQFPRTIDLLERRGYDVVALPTAEIGKIDAGLSCMSLRWRRPAPNSG